MALGLRVGGDGADLEAEIVAMGRRAVRVPMDVTSRAQVSTGVERVDAELGGIDILVNNAGLGPPETPVEDATEADFDLTFEINVKGLFLVSQAVGRGMIERRGGRIINLSSQAGFVALPGEAIYCASKAAVSHLTKCLAVEWGRYGINVNAVAPTFIRTPGTAAGALPTRLRGGCRCERIAGLHRIGEPVDVAGAVVFLASPAAVAGDRHDPHGRRRLDGSLSGRWGLEPESATRRAVRQPLGPSEAANALWMEASRRW